MVQNARADDVIELLREFTGTLDRELKHLEVIETVFRFQISRMRDAARADVDSDDSRAGPAQRIVSGLGRAAAGDEDASVVTVSLGRPEEMRFGAPARVVPVPAIRLQVVYRRRVGVTFVKVTHRLVPSWNAGR